MIACNKLAKVPKLSLSGHVDNKRVRKRSITGPKR